MLEGDPHSVLEGMIIGGYAIGAPRASSTSAPSTRWPSSGSSMAIDRRRERGLLGENILGTGFDFDLELKLRRAARSSAARRRR